MTLRQTISQLSDQHGQFEMARSNVWNILGALVILTTFTFYLTFRAIFRHNEERANPDSYLNGHKPDSLGTMNETVYVAPFSTQGRHMVDDAGRRVQLFSVNWYGASDEGFVVGGLERQHRDEIARTICSMGFNSVRLPYSDELVIRNPLIVSDLLTANSDLWGLTALQIYAAVVESLTSAGLFVIINNHITQARWCCDGFPCDSSWKNNYLGPFCKIRQTEDSWISNIETIMLPHVSNPNVIGVDLRNEPRDVTDKFLWPAWASAAENASVRLHAMQPHWLMIVEGISSANDISGAHHRPIHLTVPNKLIYSPHIYGWSGWGKLSPFWKRSYDSFAAEMQHNWAYLLEQDIAPIWIGEIGAPAQPNKGDLHYWRNLIKYLDETGKRYDADIGLAYWAVNPRKWKDNEVEGYGLLRDDWKTVVWDYRLVDMLGLCQTKQVNDDLSRSPTFNRKTTRQIRA